MNIKGSEWEQRLYVILNSGKVRFLGSSFCYYGGTYGYTSSDFFGKKVEFYDYFDDAAEPGSLICNFRPEDLKDYFVNGGKRKKDIDRILRHHNIEPAETDSILIIDNMSEDDYGNAAQKQRTLISPNGVITDIAENR